MAKWPFISHSAQVALLVEQVSRPSVRWSAIQAIERFEMISSPPIPFQLHHPRFCFIYLGSEFNTRVIISFHGRPIACEFRRFKEDDWLDLTRHWLAPICEHLQWKTHFTATNFVQNNNVIIGEAAAKQFEL